MSYQAMQRHGCILLNKPVWKDYILYGFNCIAFWKNQNYGSNKNSMVARSSGGEVEEWIDRTQGIFRAMKLSCMIL